eukprot:RCo048992
MPGKAKKERFRLRHDPLSTDLEKDRFVTSKKDVDGADANFEVTEDGFVPEKLSKQIFAMARENAEIENEDDDEEVELEYSETGTVQSAFADNISMPDIEAALDPDEEALINSMMPQSSFQTRNLADIILSKIREKEMQKLAEAQGVQEQEKPEDTEPKIDPKIVKVYRSIGRILEDYRCGRIPKALKMLPHIANWEELLLLTRPHQWSPQAMFQCTRIFSGNLNEAQTQRFFQAVLLPSIRDYIRQNRNLHPSLFLAVRKAVFRQKAFMKGFLIPLCEERDCTLREALIIGSLLQKTHVEVVHAAVAIAKIALLPYSGACSLFLRLLFDKKFGLPLACIDAVVQHFGSFLTDNRPQFPVVWHQSLLTFVQRYKNDLTPAQVDLLFKVANKHQHHLITSEIRRELMPQVMKNQQERERVAKRLSNLS